MYILQHHILQYHLSKWYFEGGYVYVIRWAVAAIAQLCAAPTVRFEGSPLLCGSSWSCTRPYSPVTCMCPDASTHFP